MNLKNFNDFIKVNSTDPKNFEKRIIFAGESIDLFETLTNPLDLPTTNLGRPVFLWGDFKLTSEHINESSDIFIYNKANGPTYESVCDSFINEGFVPKTIKDRSGIRKMAFPIVGLSDDGSEDFKTYGKFKKSEKKFSKFREKIQPRNTFNVLVFREEPIHIDEQIGGLKFDILSKTFPFYDKIKQITKKVNEKYNLDFYHIQVLEKDGSLFLNKIGIDEKLSPIQQIKVYETAYSDYYQAKLPVWFRNSINEKYLTPYFKSKAYDAKLVKPKYGCDCKKYLTE